MIATSLSGPRRPVARPARAPCLGLALAAGAALWAALGGAAFLLAG